MENFWDRLKSGIKEGATVSAEKVEVYSKIGKLKLEQFNFKKQIKKCEGELGILLYHLMKNEKGDSVTSNENVLELIKQIDDAKEEIEKLATSIAAIKAEKGVDGEEISEA